MLRERTEIPTLESMIQNYNNTDSWKKKKYNM